MLNALMTYYTNRRRSSSAAAASSSNSDETDGIHEHDLDGNPHNKKKFKKKTKFDQKWIAESKVIRVYRSKLM